MFHVIDKDKIEKYAKEQKKNTNFLNQLIA